MVCVAVKGEPVIGIIHKPFNDKQTYWAWVKHGVSKNLHVEPVIIYLFIHSFIG